MLLKRRSVRNKSALFYYSTRGGIVIVAVAGDDVDVKFVEEAVDEAFQGFGGVAVTPETPRDNIADFAGVIEMDV